MIERRRRLRVLAWLLFIAVCLGPALYIGGRPFTVTVLDGGRTIHAGCRSPFEEHYWPDFEFPGRQCHSKGNARFHDAVPVGIGGATLLSLATAGALTRAGMRGRRLRRKWRAAPRTASQAGSP